MEQFANSDINKKHNLEDLSKNELIRKCAHLLTLAQKAKQAKASLQDENSKLKEMLSSKNSNLGISGEVTKELSVSHGEMPLVKMIYELGDSLNNVSDEMSVKSKLTEFKKHVQTLTHYLNNEEVQQVLSHFKFNISSREMDNYEVEQQLDNINELKQSNVRLREKIKFYHTKIVKLASNVKSVKDEKNYVLNVFKSYMEQVQNWKDQLCICKTTVVRYIENIELENQTLKQQLDKKDTGEPQNDLMETISQYQSKLDSLKLDYEHLVSKLKEVQTTNKDLEVSKESNVKELNDLRKNYATVQNNFEQLTKVYQDLQKSNEEQRRELVNLNNEKKSFKIILEEKSAMTEDNKKHEKLMNDLKKELKSYEKLGEKSSQEMRRLVDENKSMSSIIENLQQKLDKLEHTKLVQNADIQTDADSCFISSELEEQLINLKRENSELLIEMNEMNQAIKERGETISMLEAHCEEVKKKLQIYEAQANKNIDSISQKEKTIDKLTADLEALKMSRQTGINDKELVSSLRKEIDYLKEKLNANLDTSIAENEAMSTSTVSRADERIGLKELEGSWEERYAKLRSLAIKLKGKIREQNSSLSVQQKDNEELKNKLTASVSTIQALQSEIDKLQNELDDCENICRQYENRLSTVATEISNTKLQLASKDEAVGQLKNEIETLKGEKQATENWKKQISGKIQTLRKEVEANNVMKKDFEARITRLTSDLDAKEQALKSEIENHKQTKNLLDQSSNECRKNTVLSLEMQDYERSQKDTAKKLEKQNNEIATLKSQVESQKSTMNALREQNKLLEERINEEKENVALLNSEMAAQKKQILILENDIEMKEDKLQNLTLQLETARSVTEELSTELSKAIAEHQKVNAQLKEERDSLRGQTMGLQQSLREIQDECKLKTDELTAIRQEYDKYKVRAQSILRQNHNHRDLGLEEKHSEELATLKAQSAVLLGQLNEYKEQLKTLKNTNTGLTMKEEANEKKIKELQNEISVLQNKHSQLSAKFDNTVVEHAETVRSLKVHAETLAQCYRQQISEQEARHNKEIIELQSKIEKAPSPVEHNLPPPLMHREEGEGSENTESTYSPNKVHPVPLERLLATEDDQELANLKKQLHEQELKLSHLTALLADTEQDLAKHTQMNEVLKEEIRRQQRSQERERHAENWNTLKMSYSSS
ncbi:unnamed protein product [Acanthoscelides obtectus]|uniref:Uncharacterized protein n=4 Tax=Acanthoscelides obtectus TaxID=200917 RepID=A0A9P0M5H4_ACAOB|nr:unnamed protein product [Acanthoscelides obtectus]CAK1641582.1 GRIP and coiled-coil domain-containing protein 2 [Acanthoscelides obtectus]